jgi:hypothetical protein
MAQATQTFEPNPPHLLNLAQLSALKEDESTAKIAS